MPAFKPLNMALKCQKWSLTPIKFHRTLVAFKMPKSNILLLIQIKKHLNFKKIVNAINNMHEEGNLCKLFLFLIMFCLFFKEA